MQIDDCLPIIWFDVVLETIKQFIARGYYAVAHTRRGFQTNDKNYKQRGYRIGLSRCRLLSICRGDVLIKDRVCSCCSSLSSLVYVLPAKLSRLKLKLSWHYISKRVERLKAIREICWLSFINISVISSFINISVISSFASVSYQENKLITLLPYYLIRSWSLENTGSIYVSHDKPNQL